MYLGSQALPLLLLPILLIAQEHVERRNVNGTLVVCHTTAADEKPFVLEIKREWAPVGSDRFLELVESGYFSEVPFFRVVKGFLTQFGITPNRDLRKYWRGQGTIEDDASLGRPFKRGDLSFAGGGPNTRDMQLFIAYADSDFLGKAPWEVPIGRVVSGMDVLEALYDGYGDIHPFGPGPDQTKIWEEGNEYLRRDFPLLDYLKGCSVITAGESTGNPILKPSVDKIATKLLDSVGNAYASEGSAEEAELRKSAEQVVVRYPRGTPGPLGFACVLCCIGLFMVLLSRQGYEKRDSKSLL